MIDYSTYIITPLSGAIIGYFTNWLAIKMLFRPLTEKRIFGFKLPFTPGLIPKERHKLAKNIAGTLSGHLLTEQTLIESLNSEETIEGIKKIMLNVLEHLENDTNTIEHYLMLLLKERYTDDLVGGLTKKALEKLLPGIVKNISLQMNDNEQLNNIIRSLAVQLIENNAGKLLGLFINPDKIYENIRQSFIDYLAEPENHIKIHSKLCELIDMIPEAELKTTLASIQIGDLTTKLISPHKDRIVNVLQAAVRPIVAKASAYVASSLNIEKIAEDKMNSFEISDAEKIIISVVDRELKAITVVGGVLGLLIGFLPAIFKLMGI